MRIYVLYGRGIRTGGPEAVHQLVHELRGQGVEAFVVPDRRTVHNARVREYDMYDAPEILHLPDESDAVVIAPEVYLPELLRLQRARLVCWWLSIDNSPVFRAERYLADLRAGWADPPRLREWRSLIWLAHREARGWRRRLQHLEHVAQSHYARSYLYRRLSIDAPLLTDYLRGAHATPEPLAPSTRQGVTVAFNPAKGARLNRRVQRLAGPGIQWLPISGMNPDEVRRTLGTATIYLDLGQHPGRDRMPREAALAGAVTVVARRGSGADEVDVPIPREHTAPADGDVAAAALEVVRRVAAHPEAAFDRQQAYRHWIRCQEHDFSIEVANLRARLARSSSAT